MNVRSPESTVKPEPTVPADAGLSAPVTSPVLKMARVAAGAATIWILRFDRTPEDESPREARVRSSTASLRERRRALLSPVPNIFPSPHGLPHTHLWEPGVNGRLKQTICQRGLWLCAQ